MPTLKRSTGPGWIYDPSDPALRYLELAGTGLFCLLHVLPNSGGTKGKREVCLLEFGDGKKGFHPSGHSQRFRFPVSERKGAPAMLYKVSEAIEFAKQILMRRFRRKGQ